MAYSVVAVIFLSRIGGFDYSNSENSLANGWAGEATGDWLHFVDYAEGIYVGYRFYETRFIGNLTGKCDEEATPPQSRPRWIRPEKHQLPAEDSGLLL